MPLWPRVIGDDAHGVHGDAVQTVQQDGDRRIQHRQRQWPPQVRILHGHLRNAELRPGTTSRKVSVAVLGDTAAEPDETFTVTLANAVNATLGTATATGGTITNDDAAPVTP